MLQKRGKPGHFTAFHVDSRKTDPQSADKNLISRYCSELWHSKNMKSKQTENQRGFLDYYDQAAFFPPHTAVLYSTVVGAERHLNNKTSAVAAICLV